MKDSIIKICDNIERTIYDIIDDYGLTIYIISCILFVLGIVIFVYASSQK